jgi:ribosomal protein L35AE/L33A
MRISCERLYERRGQIPGEREQSVRRTAVGGIHSTHGASGPGVRLRWNATCTSSLLGTHILRHAARGCPGDRGGVRKDGTG